MAGVFRLPLIPVFVAYASGLTLGYFGLPLQRQAWTIVLVSLLLLWTLLMGFKKGRWGSWIGLLLFFVLGIFSIYSYLHPVHSSSHVSRFIGFDQILLEGTVDWTPDPSPGGTQVLIQANKVILLNRTIAVEGKILLFLRTEDKLLRMGDRLRFLCTLYSPHTFHNPGGFSYERYLAFQRVYAIGFLSEDQGWVKIGEGFGNPILLRIETWRDHIRAFVEKETPPPSSSILKALILGERGDIPEEATEHFVATGIAHLLAISGDHLGIVAILSFSLFLWILKRSEFLLLSISVKKWAAVLSIPCILLYTFIAGSGISVVRAMIMVIVFFFSLLVNRERNLLHTLVVAAFLILLFSPPSLFDVSFQLSFLSVLSILYLVPGFLQLFRRDEISLPPDPNWRQTFRRYVKYSLLVTAVAMLGTAPFVAFHFNRISPIGLVTNLIMIPWVGFVTVPVTIVASLFSFFFYPVAVFLISINAFLTDILLRVVAFFASIPFASVTISTPTALEIILFYGLLFLAIHLRKGRRVRLLFLCLSLVLIIDLTFWQVRDRFQRNLTLTFIDVGQGDSILAEFPKGKRMLIDGGGLYGDRFDVGKSVLAPFLWKKKIRQIDYLVLTHPDPDHLKGLNFIASHFSIDEFWENGFKEESEPYRDLKKVLEERRVKVRSVHKGIPAERIGEVTISFLNPLATGGFLQPDQNRSFRNNSSLVMALRFKQVKLLLPGDIEKEAEYRIVREGDNLKADLLKIPHHGSLSSSTLAFLERVKPVYAILSVGERNVGKLPHPEVLRRYDQLGATLFRTDRHGAIEVVTDGERIEVKTFLRFEKEIFLRNEDDLIHSPARDRRNGW